MWQANTNKQKICIDYVQQTEISQLFSSLVKTNIKNAIPNKKKARQVLWEHNSASIFLYCKCEMSQRCWRNYLVFSSLFSDLFHRKKLNTATCIITAILGYNKKKNWNTFNKIKTFKYSKIFAWKYKTTQKALKSNLNSLEGGKKKKKSWSARSFFPYIIIRARRLPSDGSIVEFGVFCLLMRTVVPLLDLSVHPRWACTWLRCLLKSRRASVAFCPSLAGFTYSTKPTHTHKPWVSCSSAPSHWCRLFFVK